MNACSATETRGCALLEQLRTQCNNHCNLAVQHQLKAQAAKPKPTIADLLNQFGELASQFSEQDECDKCRAALANATATQRKVVPQGGQQPLQSSGPNSTSGSAVQARPAPTLSAADAALNRADYVEALRILQPLAEQGNAAAQNRLGSIYHDGTGVTQNYTESLKWYRKAADQGIAIAQLNVGTMYENGLGVAKNYADALTWYRKAADQGLALAQSKLASMYYNGRGVTRNYVEAVKWYRKAADQGFAEAQNNLGVMYSEGKGVKRDYVEAHKWYSLAASNATVSEAKGREHAVKNRDSVAARMTAAQIAEAQTLASEWKPTNVSPLASSAEQSSAIVSVPTQN
jgi:TPR repeat protein